MWNLYQQLKQRELFADSPDFVTFYNVQIDGESYGRKFLKEDRFGCNPVWYKRHELDYDKAERECRPVWWQSWGGSVFPTGIDSRVATVTIPVY